MTAARKETLRLPSGEIVEVGLGWNELPTGGRAYLRRDGSVMLDLAPLQGSTRVEDTNPQPVEDGSPADTPAVPALEPPYPSWSRPPFTKDHTLSTKHAAYSARRVDPLVEELVASTLEAAAFLGHASFRPALEAWARAEARSALLAAWLDEHGLLDDDGEPRAAAKLALQVESLAMKMRSRLGLDAASRASIEASLTTTAASAVSIEGILAKGAEQLRQRAARQTEETPS